MDENLLVIKNSLIQIIIELINNNKLSENSLNTFLIIIYNEILNDFENKELLHLIITFLDIYIYILNNNKKVEKKNNKNKDDFKIFGYLTDKLTNNNSSAILDAFLVQRNK